MKRIRFGVVVLALPVLAACGGSGGVTSGGSVQGVVTLPGALGSTSASQPGVLAARIPWWTKPAAERPAPSGLHAGDAIPGQYIVRVRAGLTAQSLGALSVAGQALKPAQGIPALGLSVYRAVSTLDAAGSARVLTALQADSRFLSVEPDRWYEVLKTPNDKFYPIQWDSAAMNLPKAWDTSTGAAVTVAVVDTGITAHPDLAGKRLSGYDFVSDPNNAGDGNGDDPDPTDLGGDSGYHGSHVAGTIAAATNNDLGIAGVSWGAKIVPVRVLGTTGGGSSSDILRGVYWAAGGDLGGGTPKNPNPAKVINLSLGGKGSCSPAEQDVYNQVIQAGVTVVVAAGNDNVNASGFTPASCAGVVVVGAIGPDGVRAPYSNYGSRVDVMAPGGNMELAITYGSATYPGGILSTVYDPDSKDYAYAFYQGTSMAAPHVAGAVALLLGEQPGLTPTQVLTALKNASAPLTSAQCGVANGCGAGLLDASALLTGTNAGGGTTPTTPSTRKDILVAALYQVGNDFDENRSKLVTLNQTSLLVPYEVSDLSEGSYVMAAWQDLNNDQQVNTGDQFGVYQKTVAVGGGGTIKGIDIDLKPYSLSGQSAGGSRSGSLASAFQSLQHR